MNRTVEIKMQKQLRDKVMEYYTPQELKRIKRRNKIRYRKMFLIVCAAQLITMLILKLFGV